jgi:hypothetical protein
MSIIRIGGIDPSLRATGFGMIEYDDEAESINVLHCGVVKTPIKFKKTAALLYMIEAMIAISKRDEWEYCDNVLVEFPAAIYNSPIKNNMSDSEIRRNTIRSFSAGAIPPVAGVAGACIGAFQRDDRVIPIYPTVWNRARKKVDTKNILLEYLGSPKDWHWDFPCPSSSEEHVFDALGMCFWMLEEHYFKYPDA